MTLTGLVATIDGATLIKETISASETESEKLGLELANLLLSMGAKKILGEIYSTPIEPKLD